MAEPQATNVPVDLIKRYIRRFFMLFIVVGLGLMVVGATPVIETMSAADWPSTQGMIVSSDIRSRTTKGRTVRTLKVVYRYSVKGVGYKGERIRFGADITPGRSSSRAVAEKYWEGKTVEVFYDPADPTQSVLERALDAEMFVMPGLGLLFFLLGAVVTRKLGQEAATIRQSIPLPVSRGGRTFLDGLIRDPSSSAKGADAAREAASARETSLGDFLSQRPPRAPEVEKAMSRRDPSPWSTPGPAFLAPGSESDPAWRRILKIILWLILVVLVILYAVREGWFNF